MIKKGEYFRTRWGVIGKVIDIPKFSVWHDDGFSLDNGKFISCGRKLMKQLKSTKNILDLLQPQDLLYIDIDPYDGYGGIAVPRVPETQAELDKYIEKIKIGDYKLKGIVTHELLEECVYKEGDNE